MTELASLPEVHKTPLMRDTEAMFSGRDIRLVLVELFNRFGNQRAVARRLGLSQSTINAWFRDLDIVVDQRRQATLRAVAPRRR